MSDEDELEDHILGVIANAIQGASGNFASMPDGAVLKAELRRNDVSDHLAEAVLDALTKHGYKIAETPNAKRP